MSTPCGPDEAADTAAAEAAVSAQTATAAAQAASTSAAAALQNAQAASASATQTLQNTETSTANLARIQKINSSIFTYLQEAQTAAQTAGTAAQAAAAVTPSSQVSAEIATALAAALNNLPTPGVFVTYATYAAAVAAPPSGQGFVRITTDETNDGEPTTYFYDGVNFEWIISLS